MELWKVVNFDYILSSQLETRLVRALREDFTTVLAKKTEEIERLNDMIREMRLIAEQYNELQYNYHDLQSEKAAADSQVKELTALIYLAVPSQTYR